jgi:hypothetical protein
MYTTLHESTIDCVTTTPHPKPVTTEHTPRHHRVRRYAITFGVSAMAVTLAWWWSPVLVGVLALAAPFVLAIALTPRTFDNDPHDPDRDWRNHVGWWL